MKSTFLEYRSNTIKPLYTGLAKIIEIKGDYNGDQLTFLVIELTPS